MSSSGHEEEAHKEPIWYEKEHKQAIKTTLTSTQICQVPGCPTPYDRVQPVQTPTGVEYRCYQHRGGGCTCS